MFPSKVVRPEWRLGLQRDFVLSYVNRMLLDGMREMDYSISFLMTTFAAVWICVSVSARSWCDLAPALEAVVVLPPGCAGHSGEDCGTFDP